MFFVVVLYVTKLNILMLKTTASLSEFTSSKFIIKQLLQLKLNSKNNYQMG